MRELDQQRLRHGKIVTGTFDPALLSNRKRLAAMSKAELELENQRLRAENDVLRRACLIFARGTAGGGF